MDRLDSLLLQPRVLKLPPLLWLSAILVISTVPTIVFGQDKDADWLKFVFLVALFIPMTSTYYISLRQRRYAFFHLFAAALGLIAWTGFFYILELLAPSDTVSATWDPVLAGLGIAGLIGGSLALISFFVSIPYAVIPYYRRISAPEQIEVPLLSPRLLGERFGRIRNAIGQIERSIATEVRGVDQAMDQLSSEIESRNRELEDIQTERQRLTEQLRQYEAIAALTREQADAVTEALRRGKYVDYVVGFVLGLISSGLFFLLTRIPAFLN